MFQWTECLFQLRISQKDTIRVWNRSYKTLGMVVFVNELKQGNAAVEMWQFQPLFPMLNFLILNFQLLQSGLGVGSSCFRYVLWRFQKEIFSVLFNFVFVLFSPFAEIFTTCKNKLSFFNRHCWYVFHYAFPPIRKVCAKRKINKTLLLIVT